MHEGHGRGWIPYADRRVARPRSGAGCMILARRTGRFLFCLRPEDSASGGTWSPWGGKTEERETPRDTALREVREETGLNHPGEIFHLYHASNRGFEYDTFLLVVNDEFDPVRSAEWQDCAWLPIEEAPRPLHWGLGELLADRTAVKLLAKAVWSEAGRPCDLEPSTE